jgi:succinate dehydrogenase hydrophobic anchor subunit
VLYLQFDCLTMGNETKVITGNIRWLAQVILGILLVLLVSIHLVVNHWAAPQGLLTYADIIHYYDFPGIAMMEAIFLIVVTSHCILGLYGILLDINLPPNVTRAVAQILIALGATTIFYGIWLIISIV